LSHRLADDMLRFAFLPTPLSGHVNPTLSLARALVADGSQVTYHLPEPFRTAVCATGAQLHAIRFPPAPRDGPGDPLVRLARAPLEMTRAGVSVLPQVLDRLEDEPPDAVVYDALSVWGRVAAEHLRLPRAKLWASYAMNDRFSYFVEPGAGPRNGNGLASALDRFATDMDVISATYRTPRLNLPDLFMHSEPLTIVFAPRALQPAADTFGERYLFAGPSLRGGDDEPLDPRLDDFARGPLVYVSLGTVFNDWPAFYPLCHEALGAAGRRVLVAGADDAEEAAGVLVRRHVPQLAVLARAAVFVTHGGMNSVMEALAQGVPMVLISQMPEQAITAARVAAAGAGRVLRREQLTARALRRAVDAVADDPAHARAARALWTRIAGAGGGAAVAAAALTRYARAGRVASGSVGPA
jgi:MGT family glycosyltransferase